MIGYANPYFGQDFFGFFWQLLMRIGQLFTGQGQGLYPDEIQMLVLIGVSISGAIVGTFLTLRRITMLANALSHTILLGIVITYIALQSYVVADTDGHLVLNIQAMMVASVVTGLATTFLTHFLTHTLGLQEDASVGLVFTSMFALGVILVTIYTRNAHIGTEVVMGNVDALHIEDLKLVYAILAFNLIAFGLFFKEFTITTFDPALSRALGISTVVFNYLLMIQVSATVVAAFRAVGVLMILAFITGPVLMARMLTDRLRVLIVIACAIGSVLSVIGVALSRHLLSVYGLPLSTGGLVVCLIIVTFIGVAAQWKLRRS